MTIAQRTLQYNFTVNAKTSIANKSSLNLKMEWGLLHQITVYVPPGHVGQTGIQIYRSGTQIVPWGGNSPWYNLNDTTVTFTIEDEVDTGLVAYGYNTDQVAHTFYVRLFYTPIVLVNKPVSLLPIQVI